MEAREIAEEIKDCIARARPDAGDALLDGALVNAETRWGYGDADFFVVTEDEGTFLVTVAKVSE